MTDDMVNKYYVMNPETDILVPDGRGLKNGMTVLIEDSSMRANVPLAKHDQSEKFRALQYNRWCVVSNLQIERHPKGDVVTFVGTYLDGTQHKRWAGINKAWLCKRDSASYVKDQAKAQEEMDSVVLEAQKSAVFNVVTTVAASIWKPKEVGNPDFMDYCGNATAEIVKIFTGKKV